MRYHSAANKKSLSLRPWAGYINSARARAKKSGRECTISLAWAKATYNGRCALTGLPFVRGIGKKGPRLYSPSIDRIDPVKGYTPENCRFILFALNAFKGAGSDEDMVLIAKVLLTHSRYL